MLKVCGFSKVNAGARTHTRDLRVLWALEELQIPFELVGMDHPAHDLNAAAYLPLSPVEQISGIDDDDLLLSESGAIAVYLAKKVSRLIPDDQSGEALVLCSAEFGQTAVAQPDGAGLDGGCRWKLRQAP